MANINQTVNSIGTGPRFQFTVAGDSYRILSSVTVESTNSIAIFGGFGNQSVFVDGLVKAPSNAIYLSGGNNEIFISAFATVMTATGGDGFVFVEGGNSSITNHGRVLAAGSVGLVTSGGDNEMLNTGKVDGAGAAFLGTFGSSGDRLINEGTMSANDLFDAGYDYRYNNGVWIEGPDTLVINRAGAKISATSSEGAGVGIGYYSGPAGGDGSRIENHGLIQSRQWYGIDFANLPDTESASVENYGTIKGGNGAFRGNVTGDIITNRGKMIGDIELGAGDDFFDGDKGTVKGAILGSTGNDYIFGGKGNQSINGGLDSDVIAGGTGIDTLYGDLGIDTFILRKGFGADTVEDFAATGAGQDLVDLKGFKAIKNFADLENNHLEKHGNDMWITGPGGDRLILKGVAPGDLDAANFIF